MIRCLTLTASRLRSTTGFATSARGCWSSTTLTPPTTSGPGYPSLAIIEASYGPSHPYAARMLATLADVLRDLGRPHEALPLAERALAIVNSHYDTERPGFAALQGELAVLIGQLQQLANLRK